MNREEEIWIENNRRYFELSKRIYNMCYGDESRLWGHDRVFAIKNQLMKWTTPDMTNSEIINVYFSRYIPERRHYTRRSG